MKLKEINNPIQPEAQDTSIAQNQLLKIGNHAIQLHNIISDSQETDPWVSKKINLASEYVKKVHDHMLEYTDKEKDITEYRNVVIPRDEKHYRELMKHLQDIEWDPETRRDPKLMAEIRRRRLELRTWAEKNIKREVAPPGREKQVKALKGKVDNPYAVAWASYNKNKKNEDAGTSSLKETARMAIELIELLKNGGSIDESVQNILNQAADNLHGVYNYESYTKTNPYREELDSNTLNKHAGVIQKGIDEILARETAIDDINTKPGMLGILNKKVNEIEKEMAKEVKENMTYEDMLQNKLDSAVKEYDTPEKKAERDALMQKYLGKGGTIEKVPAGQKAYKGKQLKPAFKKEPAIKEDAQMDELKRWYRNYSKYSNLNGDKLPFGLYMQLAQTGVPTDGMAADEASKAIQDAGLEPDKEQNALGGGPIDSTDVDFDKADAPTTNAMKQELIDIMGVDAIGEEEITKAMKMLGVQTGMESVQENVPFGSGMNLLQRAVFNKWISADEWFHLKDEWHNAADEIEQRYSDWPDGQGFGSSDHNFAIKELMGLAGYEFDEQDRSGSFIVTKMPEKLEKKGIKNVRMRKEPVATEDVGGQALAKNLSDHFQVSADSLDPEDQSSQEHEEYEYIADEFKKGLQAGMDAVNDSEFEFSWNPFDVGRDGKGKLSDYMADLLKKYGFSAGMSKHHVGAEAYLVKDGKPVTKPEKGFSESVQEDANEGGMPASIIKHKQKLAKMTDKELADRFKDKDEKTLRQMAWRHGHGHMSSHYWDRAQKGKTNETKLKEDTDEYNPARLLGAAQASLMHGLEMAEYIGKKDYEGAEQVATVVRQNWPSLIDKIQNAYKNENQEGDGIQPVDLKRLGQSEPKIYVHKDGKTIMIPKSKHNEYLAKGWKQSALKTETSYESKLAGMLNQRLK